MAKKSNEAHEPGHEPPEGTPAAFWVSISKIHRAEDNPRKNASSVPAVKRSVDRVGWGAPILCRKANGEIIAGDTRYQAALDRGMQRVPVRWLDVNEREARILRVADNKIGELSDWDDERLAAYLASVRDEPEDLAATGFEESEAEALILAQEDDTGDGTGDGDGDGPEAYEIIITLPSAREQERVLHLLQGKGLTCRPG